MDLPAGNYLVQGRMGAYNGTTATENPSCLLHVLGGTDDDFAFFAVPGRTETPVSLVRAFQFTDPQTIRLECSQAGLSFGRSVLVATEVTTVH